jgi:superfamily II DNA or RNA helicase
VEVPAPATPSPSVKVTLAFRGGTIEVQGLAADAPAPPGCLWDARTACFRAPAAAYATLRRALARDGRDVDDRARGYAELDFNMGPLGGFPNPPATDSAGQSPAESTRTALTVVHREPRPYQAEALAAWKAGQHRGVVVLPTGAGKTWVACLAIDDRRRSTLVIAPTLDLVRQWYDVLRSTFGVPVGVVGGGEYDVQALTVSTYDSAHLHMEHLGDKFGLVVFDECHHLPSASYALAARASLAPFRLGLTATPERTDGRESDMDALCGPIVYRKDIVELSGDYLAPYETVRLTVELGAEDRRAHDEARGVYRDFLARNGIRMSSPTGWSDFVIRAARSDEGRRG